MVRDTDNMAFLFGRNKQKNPGDLPRLTKELLPRIDILPPQKVCVYYDTGLQVGRFTDGVHTIMIRPMN